MTLRIARMHCSLRRAVSGAGVIAVVVALSMVGDVRADPAADALAKLTELSRQAVQSREAVTAAQWDLDARLAAQATAEDRHRADLVALESASSQLQTHQAAVDRVAANMYMGGRSGWLAALLTADSPQQLIDQVWLQRTVPAKIADQTKALQVARARGAAAAQVSEMSASVARAATERSAAARADLQATWSELQRQIAAAEAQYATLTPSQRAVFDNPPPPPPEPQRELPPPPPPLPEPPAPEASAPAQGDSAIIAMPSRPPEEIAPPFAAARAEIPEVLPVGIASEVGLQPNTIVAARAISAQFPQIAAIDGVRPDSKPWHPSGLAIDVMIPNPESPEGIALGNEILAFVLRNAHRFGLQDAIWRDIYHTPGGPQGSGYGHFDHLHITTTPRR